MTLRSCVVACLLLASANLQAAIVNICGFETGSGYEANAVSGTQSVQSTTKRSGLYALQVNPTTTAVGYREFSEYNSGGADTSFNRADIYVRCYFRYGTKPASGSEPIFSAHIASADALKFELRLDSDGKLSAYDSTATIIGSAGSTVLAQDSWYRLGIRVGTGATADFLVAIDGVTELSGTADLHTSNNSNTKLGKWTNRNSQTVNYYYDDCAWDSTTMPGAGQIVALNPTGDGNVTTWTIGAGGGADWENVDETPSDDDTTYLLSTLVDDEGSTVALEDAAAETITGTINAVKPILVVKRDGASNGTVNVRLRSASTDATGADVGATAAYNGRQIVHLTDPATSAAWTVTALNDVQIGVVEAETTDRSRWSYGALMVDFTPAVGGIVNLPPGSLMMMGVGGALGFSEAEQLRRIVPQLTGGTPAVVIIAPTSADGISVSSGTQTVIAVARDDVGIASITWACATCSTTSGTATLSTSGGLTYGTFTVALGAAQPNTITVTASDGTLTAQDQVILTAPGLPDSTPPVVTITTDCGSGPGANCSVGSGVTSIDLAGICTDNSGSCASVTNALVGCTGLASWNCLGIPLGIGANVLQVVALDGSGNQHIDSITVTRPATLAWSTAGSLGTYQTTSNETRDVVAVGGTGGIAYAEVIDGGDVLGSGDCADITFADVGEVGRFTISTPPAQPVTCSVTIRADDAGGDPPVDREFTIVIDDSANGNTYYETLCKRADVLLDNGTTPVCYSLRTQAIIDSFAQTAGATVYDATLDAARNTTPVWDPPMGTLAADLSSGATSIAVADLTNNEASGIGNNQALLIGNEIVVVTRAPTKGCPVTTTLISCVTRGQFGTSAAAHTGGTAFAKNRNTFGNNIRLPIRTPSTANRYVFIWDSMLSQSYFTATGEQDKHFQFLDMNNDGSNTSDGARWFEIQQTRASSDYSLLGCTVDTLVHIGCVAVRAYNDEGGGSNWLSPHVLEAVGTLNGGITDSATTATFSQTFAAGMLVQIDSELIRITSTGTTVSITRGVNSTTPASHANGAAVSKLGGDYVCTDAGCTNAVNPDTLPLRKLSGAQPGYFAYRADKWTRYVLHVDSRVDNYDPVTLWVCDEDVNCTKIHDEVPLSLRMGAQAPNSLRSFWWELNSSANAYQHTEPWHAYLRNFVGLVNPSDCTAASCSALLLKPLR